MGTYAADTTVSAEKSRAEIERTLQRYGATSFSYGWEGEHAAVMFAMNDRRVRFVLRMPSRDDREYTHTPTRGNKRTESQAYESWEKACRQRWRALALVVKAKLEAVDAGISEFEDEFMAQIVLPDGGTVGDFMRPQIEEAYVSNTMPSMLQLGPG